jgi:MATE family multidrug resistance protein
MGNEKNIDLQVGISDRQILRLALPISLSILVPQINYITNNIFLGGLNEQSLAAAGITGVYYLLFAVIGTGLNNGLQALIARRAGENRVGEIGKLFFQGVRIALFAAALGIAITWLIAPIVIKYSLESKTLRETTLGFIRIRIWGLPFLYVYQMRNALLVGTNRSRYLVYGTLTEAVVNIVLDYGLIYGHLGLPRMGFNGAALASILAEASGLLVVYLVIHFRGISRKLELYASLAYDATNTRLILSQSSPLIFQYAISIGSWLFFFILVEHRGQVALAVSNTMRNIFGLSGIFTWAFASTANAMVSNVIGQGRKDQVIPLIHRIVRISMLFGATAFVLLNLFPRSFLSIYGQDAAFLEAAIPVLRVVSVAILIWSFGTVWLNSVTGTGNTRINLGIEVITIIFYILYVYLVLGYYHLPVLYGWMSEWLYWIFTFGLSYLYMRSGHWKKKVI